MLNKYIAASAIGVLLFMSGCTKDSQKNEFKVPEIEKITNIQKVNYNNVTDEEKKWLLNKELWSLNEDIQKNNYNGFKNPEIVTYHKYFSFSIRNNNDLCTHTFSHDLKKNEFIKQEAALNQWSRKWNGNCKDDYLKILENVETTLIGNYNKTLKEFSEFKTNYLIEEKKGKDLLKNFSVNLVNNNILPEDVLKNITYDFKFDRDLERSYDLVKKYNKDINETMSYIIKNHEIYLDRYKIKFKVFDNEKKSLKELSNDPFWDIGISNIYFNFLPNDFYLKDQNLLIEVKNNRNSYKKEFAKIVIYNNSNAYITINSLDSFLGIEIDHIAYVRNLKLPPGTYHTLESKYIKTSWDLYESKSQKFNYGFSIEYNINGLNKTLYKKVDYTTNDFQ